jgi:hypothetical protein
MEAIHERRKNELLFVFVLALGHWEALRAVVRDMEDMQRVTLTRTS